MRFPQGLCERTRSSGGAWTRMDIARGQDSPFRARELLGVCRGAGRSRPGCESSCLFAQVPAWPWGRSGGPGRSSLARWCLGRGSLPRSLLRA